MQLGEVPDGGSASSGMFQFEDLNLSNFLSTIFFLIQLWSQMPVIFFIFSSQFPKWHFPQLALLPNGRFLNWHKLNFYFNYSEIEPNLSLIYVSRHEFSQEEKYKIGVAILARNSLSTDFQVVLFWLIH